MKKYLLILLAGMITVISSCNTDKEKTDDKPAENKVSSNVEKNLAAVHALNKFFVTGDVSLIEQGIAIGAIDHAAPGGDLVAGNMDSVKAYFTNMRNQFTDMKMEIVKEWADEEYVLQWMKFSGTSKDSQSGIPAGQRIDGMMSLHISKLKDGKAVEHWEFMQPNDLMKMMGGTQSGK